MNRTAILGILALAAFLLLGPVGINNPREIIEGELYKAIVTVKGTYAKDLIFSDQLKIDKVYVKIERDTLIYIEETLPPATILETSEAKLNILLLDSQGEKVYDREIFFNVDEKTWSVKFTINGLEKGEYTLTVETYLKDVTGTWLHKDTYTTTITV